MSTLQIRTLKLGKVQNVAEVLQLVSDGGRILVQVCLASKYDSPSNPQTSASTLYTEYILHMIGGVLMSRQA